MMCSILLSILTLNQSNFTKEYKFAINGFTYRTSFKRQLLLLLQRVKRVAKKKLHTLISSSLLRDTIAHRSYMGRHIYIIYMDVCTPLIQCVYFFSLLTFG